MEKMDVVVVGAGLSGLSAAYYLAAAGLQVLVLERGDFPGSKNVTGGRLYLGPIREIVPELLEGAPLERPVTSERLTLMSEQASTTLALQSRALADPSARSFTVLRARLDRWLGERVMEKGGFVVPQKRVDSLLQEEGRVVGIRCGAEEIRCDVTILAEGVLSMLCEQQGLKEKLAPEQAATAVKEVIELPAGSVEKRFGLPPGEGAAHLFIGAVTRGTFGGGFLYTNRDTVSLGIVLGMQALLETNEDLESHRLIEAFKARPEIAPYISEGKTAEYSAHLIRETPSDASAEPYGDGYLITGDAAGLALNTGLTVRGMDMALASGRFAADAVLRARELKDFSRKSLSHYGRRLSQSFVLQDLRTFRHAGRLIANQRLYRDYPKWINQALESLYTLGPRPKERYARTLWRALRSGPSLVTLARDLGSLRRI